MHNCFGNLVLHVPSKSNQSGTWQPMQYGVESWTPCDTETHVSSFRHSALHNTSSLAFVVFVSGRVGAVARKLERTQ